MVGCIGNLSYWVLIKSTHGAFFPVFGDGNTMPAILVAFLKAACLTPLRIMN